MIFVMTDARGKEFMRTKHYPLILKFITLGLLTQIWLVLMIGCNHRRRPEPSPPSPELSQVIDSIIEELPFPDHQATVNVSPDAGAVASGGNQPGRHHLASDPTLRRGRSD